MRNKIAWISSTATAALLTAGLAAAATPGTGHAPAHAVLAAYTASSPPVNLDNCPTLSEGYQGGCVNQLQTELNSIDNAGLQVDGIFGPQTQQAVITFQQQNGVTPADGIVGPLTKAALDKANSAATPQPGSPSSPATATSVGEQTPGATSADIVSDTPIIPGLGTFRVGFFIMQKSYGIGPISGAGDGRGFDPNMTESDNRVFLEINYEFGFAKIVVNPSCNDNRTSCNNPELLTPDRVSITSDSSPLFPNKNTQFHINIGNSRIPLDGIPRIRAELSFQPTPQGTVCIYGKASSFPSLEIYHDSPDGTVATMYQHKQARILGAADLALPGLDQQFATCTDGETIS